MAVYNWNDSLKKSGILKEAPFDKGISYFRDNRDDLKILFEECGLESISIKGLINLSCYSMFKENKILRKLLYLIMTVDRLISKFNLSSKIGM